MQFKRLWHCFKFIKNAFHKRLYSIFIFRRLMISCDCFPRYIFSSDASIWPAGPLYQRFRIDPRMEKAKNHGSLSKSPQFRPDIVAIRIGPRMKKWENHEPLSNTLYMSPFQVFYVVCRSRVFDSKISFVLSICIRLSDEKFC